MKKNTEEIDFAIDFSLSALDLAYMLAYTILQRNPILSHIIPLYFFVLSKQNYSIHVTNLLIELPVRRNRHGPVELVAHRLGKDLFDWDFVPLAPCHRDSRIHVVELYVM